MEIWVTKHLKATDGVITLETRLDSGDFKLLTTADTCRQHMNKFISISAASYLHLWSLEEIYFHIISNKCDLN